MIQIVKKQSSQNISNIENSLKKIKVQGVAPVDSWNPKFCGNLNIEIKKDGSWFYENSKITRTNLVKLFSRILKKEGEDYFLVTPVEKIGIKVAFAPFVATSIAVSGQGKTQNISFTTNIGDSFELDYHHPLRIDFNPKTDEPHPYVVVRSNLEALIDRKSFYRLVDLGLTEIYCGRRWFGVWSNNCFFPVILKKHLK